MMIFAAWTVSDGLRGNALEEVARLGAAVAIHHARLALVLA